MASDNYLDDQNNPWDTPEQPTQQQPDQQAPPAPAPKPTGSFDRERFKNEWMSKGASYGGDVDRFIRENPEFATGVQSIAGNKSGATWLPSGEVMDLVIDKGGANGAGWTGAGHADSASSPIQQYTEQNGGWWGGGPGSGSATGSGSTVASSYSGLSPEDMAKRDEIYNMLMGKAKQGTDNLREDPNVRQQSDANFAAEERSKRNYLADLAEKSGPYANMQGEERLANERVGQRTGTFEAGMVGNEMSARRAEIMQSLSMMGGLLSDQQKMSLTKELSDIDTKLKYAQLDQQNSQFGADMNYKNNELGFQMGDREAYWNNQALQNLMPS